jgi:hypothetical protein
MANNFCSLLNLAKLSSNIYPPNQLCKTGLENEQPAVFPRVEIFSDDLSLGPNSAHLTSVIRSERISKQWRENNG